MMFGSCRGGCRPTGVVCRIFGLCLFILLFTHPASAQINIIHQEGFNDDGDGTRYTMIGRGQEVLDIGPGIWEHSFLVDVIGLPAVPPTGSVKELSAYVPAPTCTLSPAATDATALPSVRQASAGLVPVFPSNPVART